MDDILKAINDPNIFIEVRRDPYVDGFEVTVRHIDNKLGCKRIFSMNDVLMPGFEIFAKQAILKMIKEVKKD